MADRHAMQAQLPLGLPAGAGPVCGVDEAGRGPLAGPVYAAAVVLHPDAPVAGLRDSKTLSARAREALAEAIRERALAWSVADTKSRMSAS